MPQGNESAIEHQVWQLKRGDVLLGVLTIDGPDQPWFRCHFKPTQAYEEVRSLFETELCLLNAGDMEAWNEAYDAIDALGLRLYAPGRQTAIEEFLLHIDGTEAWFRY